VGKVRGDETSRGGKVEDIIKGEGEIKEASRLGE